MLADVQPSALFKSGYAYVHPIRTKHCNIDASDCYTMRTLASVTAISANQGYIGGGQILKITGMAFGADASVVEIEIDGTTCVVQSVSNELITCETGDNTSASVTETNTVGQSGLRRRMYNETALDVDVNY